MSSGEITAAEMSALDENCKAFGLSTLQLMENAGSAVAKEIARRFKAGSVLVLAGKGNNGGDGFVAARHLLSLGFRVRVVLVGRERDIRTEEARRNYEILKECGCPCEEISDASALRRRCEELLADADIVVDAIFGTGFKGVPREPEATAIEILNEARHLKRIVVAVDIPSGLDADTGEAEKAEKAVHANLTVTFHKAKPALKAKKDFVGEVVVAPIGIPPAFEKLAGPGDLRSVVKKRRKESHKGEHGRILVVGGGPFAGAPALAALAALRAGADWVTVAAPKSVASTIAKFSPNLIVKPLSADILVEEDVPIVRNLAKKHDVLLIGTGLGDAEETKNAVRMILEGEECEKAVVDADGFYGVPLPFDAKKKKVILTPHAGEFSKMGVAFKASTLEEKEAFVREFSLKNGVVTLLKGHIDIISDGYRLKINKKGNAGMTVGGTGDVLAGITSAFLAVNDDAFNVAVASAYVSGAAGDLAFAEKGNCLLATDVIEKIPAVLKDFC